VDYSTAPRLGAIAIKGALDRINLDPNLVDEVYMGNVGRNRTSSCTSSCYFAGLPNTVAVQQQKSMCIRNEISMLAAQAIFSVVMPKS
jgi:acetyl-CoA C-acetyltransferase